MGDMALHRDAAILSFKRLVMREIHVLCQAQRGMGLAPGVETPHRWQIFSSFMASAQVPYQAYTHKSHGER